MWKRRETKCGWLLPRLAEYLEEALPTQQRAKIEAHVAQCVRCAAELRALQRTADVLDRVPSAESPDALWARIEARLQQRAVRPEDGVAERVSVRRRWAVAAVGVAGVFLVVVFFGLARLLSPGPSSFQIVAAPAPVAGQHDVQTYVQQHALLASREPLADQVSLGLVSAVSQRGLVRSEHTR